MDKAHKDTDKVIAALEKRIRIIYSQAQKDLAGKLSDFERRFEVKDRKHRQELKDGKITKEQYQAWLRGQVFQSRQWKSKLRQITATLTNADKVAWALAQGQVYGVFANNANWISYTLEHDAGVNFGFDLYNPDAVARLLKDNPDLLPKMKLDIPKNERWEKSLFNQQITQGIIQGENLDQIAKRLSLVTGRAQAMSLNHARTAMTSAQNAGRQDTFDRAKKMGIQTKKEWIATLDMHTRTSHARLDGQTVEENKPFEIDGYKIMFPGDPQALPALVYGCRCTMGAVLAKYPEMFNSERYDNIDGTPVKGMNYQEWYEAKTGKPLVEKPVETVEKRRRRGKV